MKAELRFFHCGDQLRNTLAAEIAEVESVVSNVSWLSSFEYIDKGITHEHQTGYNRAFSKEFERLGWERSPVLRREPKLIGDFRKGLVFVEIQFGNSTVLQYREPFKIIQHGRCFYDDSHDMSLSEVDHVLPWSFVLEDKTWNLVLACRKCNNVKRDRLTNVDAIERLCSRNEKIAKGYASAESAFLRHFSEWHSRDLSSHIRGLYDQAVADGFPEWSQGRSALP
jgi:hypothetical protein